MEDINSEVATDAPVTDVVADNKEKTSVEKEKADKKPLATEKVVQDTPAIENASVKEAVVENDEGQKVIAGPEKQKAPRKSNTKTNADGVIGSNAADYALFGAPKATDKPAKKVKSDSQVALLSDRNIRWGGVGELVKGYNIVTEEAADQWLTKKGIRKATPEEVAAHYGK